MNNAHGSVNEARRKLPRSPFRAPQSHFAHLFGLCFLALLQNICTKSLTAHANITQLQTYTTWNIVSWKDKLHKNKRNSEYVYLILLGGSCLWPGENTFVPKASWTWKHVLQTVRQTQKRNELSIQRRPRDMTCVFLCSSRSVRSVTVNSHLSQKCTAPNVTQASVFLSR